MLVTNQTSQDYWFGPLHLPAGIGQTLTIDDTSETSLYLTDDAVATAVTSAYTAGVIAVSGAAQPFPRPINGPALLYGAGTPEGSVYAPQGSAYLRRDGTQPSNLLYLKTTGCQLNTGWTVGSAGALIVDYFSSATGPFSDGANPGTSGSLNWLKWSEEANWSGFPNPYILVKDDTAGDGKLIVVDTVGLAALFPDYGVSNGLVRIDFSLDVSGTNAAKWWNCNVYQVYGSPGSWTYGVSDAVLGQFGSGTDFPYQARSTNVPVFLPVSGEAPTIWFYSQMVTQGAPYAGFAFKVGQTYQTGHSADFDASVFAQCIVTLVKPDAFAGGRF